MASSLLLAVGSLLFTSTFAGEGLIINEVNVFVLDLDCCVTKKVGNVSYSLVIGAVFHDPVPSVCLNSCIYQNSNGFSNQLFCFASGNLPVVCGEYPVALNG